MSKMDKEALDVRTRSLCDQAWARGKEQRTDLEAALGHFTREKQSFANQVAVWAIRMVLTELDWRELEAEPE